MDQRTIDQGWLTIANSSKRDDKTSGRTTRLGRTPIGDKGLGRLGSQRLARNVELVTRPVSEPATEYYVGFSWADFRDTASLGGVPVRSEQRPVTGHQHGTKLILSGLCEPDTWQGEAALQELQRRLSEMISPFQEQEASKFRVHLEVDGKQIALTEIAQRLRDTALLRYIFEFDGKVFHISGRARLTYFQPNRKDDRRLLRSLIRRNGETALFEFLATKAKKNRPPHFKLSDQPGWFVEFGTQRALDDFDGVRRVANSVANPGPFHGEVDAVSLSSEMDSDAFHRRSDYRRLVQSLAGIRVYRDGFGIRVGTDWLGLGKQWTGGRSYYGLRPGNVLGYVAISAKSNAALTETTSREGFQDTAHYQNFVALLSEFVRFAGNAQEYLRRGVLQFLKEHRERNAGVEPEDPHSKITERIDKIADRLTIDWRRIQGHLRSLRTVAAKASRSIRQASTELDEKTVGSDTASDLLAALERQLQLVSNAATDTKNVLDQISSARDRASDLKSMRKVLDRRWETLNDEVSALYESVSLGLTAEALSHEIHNIADRLAKRSSALLGQLKTGARKAQIITYVEHVQSSIAAMRKQLAHLTPSLRYLRERRERIDVLAWANDLAVFHNEHFDKKGVRVVVVQGDTNGFVVNMNRGKLTQILDNLILNAEYWLREAVSAELLISGEITITVETPFLYVKDNGKGVEESVEQSLFDPFVTTKRIGEGRGLGLFVVRQLLDSESCGITLLHDRNAYGRRYVFELDFSGAISG